MKHFNDPGDEQEKPEEVNPNIPDGGDAAAAEQPAAEEPVNGAMVD